MSTGELFADAGTMPPAKRFAVALAQDTAMYGSRVALPFEMLGLGPTQP
jgi:hypothetical protein